MSTISLRVPEDELVLFKAYAKFNNWSLSDAIRNTMIEKIEDDYDRKVFEEYEAKKAAGKVVTHPIEDLWKELGLDE